MRRKIKTLFITAVFIIAGAAQAAGQVFTVSGTVRNAANSEPMVGVTVFIENSMQGVVTDASGKYSLANVAAGAQRISFSFISYKEVIRDVDVRGDVKGLDVLLEEETTLLEEVTVRAKMESNTEPAMVSTIRISPQVTSGVSSAQIAKSPDRTASEVVRRVPGITILDDRFIVVRGLSQRYNNAWLNGLAVPSTETDSRAFSFDVVPSSQIDNLLVYKSPSPEIPGDFSGGFVKIVTKGVPDENSTEIGIQTGFNFNTQFTDFKYNPGSGTDFLGFDAGKRPLGRDFPTHLSSVTDPDEITRLTKHGFNNDWSIRSITPLPDIRLSFSMARRFSTRGGRTAGNITSISYSNTNKTVEGIRNSRYGIYSAQADKPIVLNDYTDDQYSNDVRIGAMHNWSLMLNGSDRIEFKNLFNLLGRNRLTERVGVNLNSGEFRQRQTEMLYSSRLTYTGQFSGTHTLKNDATFTWDAGYSYANRSEPDRRLSLYTGSLNAEDDELYIEKSGLRRFFQKLNDHNVSASANYRHAFGLGNIRPDLRAGLYGEFRTREYTPREFEYINENLSFDDRTYVWPYLTVEEMLDDSWLGADKVYVAERPETKNSAYSADVFYGAAYAALNIPVGRLTIYAGARLESHNTRLTWDESLSPTEEILATNDVDNLNVLPSVNLTWKFNDEHQLRLAYGRSVNRPELRELSPTVYYDFDLFSFIIGNPDLKTALIDNLDLRYEFYPAAGETVSIGAFYKHFKNPIEWAFIDAGGTYQYYYENARKATSWGFELDVRKKLDFIGLPNLSTVLNAAWIDSNVHFAPGEVVVEPDRPMQGQSPYIINAGLYYSSERLGFDATVLYNIIGRRIVGLGKNNSANNDPGMMIPDSYEMPRNTLDLSLSKKLGRMVELRLAVKDILSEDVVYKQFPRFVKDGVEHKREQVTRRYNPGQSVSVGLTMKF